MDQATDPGPMKVNEATIDVWYRRLQEVADEISTAIHVPGAPANMTFIQMDSVTREIRSVLHRLSSVRGRITQS